MKTIFVLFLALKRKINTRNSGKRKSVLRKEESCVVCHLFMKRNDVQDLKNVKSLELWL